MLLVYSEELKGQWQIMQDDEPEIVREQIMKVRKDSAASDKAHRSFGGLVKVLSSFSRQRQVELADRWIQCDRGEFYAHWAGRGRKEPQIERKWLKATKPKKFRKNLAWHKSKTTSKGKSKKITIVWVKKQRKCKDADIMNTKMEERPEVQMMDKASAKAQVRGEKKLNMDKSGKALLGAGSVTVSYCVQLSNLLFGSA